ncbi:MAG: hypothetical protein ACK5IN_03240 [Microbacterium sp.]|uniref:hypothetical protein n=1 Tax=Microbacterium sp. TaxID=51671 RepID=UPI003A88ABC9
MLIVLALIFGAVIGLGAHFALPHRTLRGAALVPMVGAFAGGAVWLLFTWLSLEATGWIWLASLAAPIVVTWATVVVTTRVRLAHDEHEAQRLKIA